MITAEAARIALCEALCPHAARVADANYPTRARFRVFDSAPARAQDLDQGEEFTPVLSVYTRAAGWGERGGMAAYGDVENSTTIEVVGELAVLAEDEAGQFADAMADNDPNARIVLAGMMAQVERIVLDETGGFPFRRFVKKVTKIDLETHAVPEFGLRYQRVFMRLTCDLVNDEFPQAGGLPPRVAEWAASLPDGSSAKTKILALAAYFPAISYPALSNIQIGAPVGEGEEFTPYAQTGEDSQ